jgi:ABC-type branched-subunit amino acid transport system ATPase component
MLLLMKNISMDFGGLRALDDVDMEVTKGTITGLIGPNGSGKTTLFNIISGFYKPTHGRIHFDGEELTGKGPHQIARMRIARTFQGTLLYDKRTLLENIQVALYCHRRKLAAHLVFSDLDRRDRARAEEILDYVGLLALRNEVVENIPFGTRHLLEIGRLLAMDPKLLLLDEPSTGLNQSEVTHELNIIRDMRERGITVFIVEHNMKVIMEICDEINVLDNGARIATGAPSEIRSNPKVIESYLGREEEIAEL